MCSRIFHRVAGDLAPSDLQLVQRATNLAAIAIERHRFEAALEYQALYDPLTDLPEPGAADAAASTRRS